jgi:putative nucleotidyltransferase with HDIG domain
MKRVINSDLQAGMIIAESVSSLNGRQILIPKGGILTEKTISNIKKWDIPYVMIKEDNSSPVVNSEGPDTDLLIGPRLPRMLVEKSIDFSNTLDSSIAEVSELFERIRTNKSIDIKQFHKLSLQIFQHLIHPSEAVNRLLFTLPKENSLAYHSVMVAALSGMLADWMELGAKNIKEIILSGLLHDVGKTQLPQHIFADKESVLMNAEMIQTHVLLTFKLLKDTKVVSAEVLAAIVQHQEYMDGSGYPQQLSGDKIHIFARIIGIVNYISNMVENCNNINPFMLLQSLKMEMFTKLDPGVCDVFTRRISDYLTNCAVILEDGRKAKIAFLPSINPSFPVLQVDDMFIDMQKNKETKIVGLECNEKIG